MREAGVADRVRVLGDRTGDEAVDGRWQRTVPVTAGRYYTFRADYRAKQVATPERSSLARVVWLDASGKQVAQPEYPVTSTHKATNGATQPGGRAMARASTTKSVETSAIASSTGRSIAQVRRSGRSGWLMP